MTGHMVNYRVTAAIAHGDAVRELRLRPADGSPVPAWKPGAHIALTLDVAGGAPLERQYSLLGEAGAGEDLRIAVLLEPQGRGGSRHLHERVQVGDTVAVSGPFDSFALAPPAGRTVLLAGGIGVTPLLSMACALAGQGAAFELHYLARSPERMVLLEEFAALGTGSIDCHATAPSGRPDLAALLGPYTEGAALYACGPQPLLQALRDTGAALGWPASSLHMESFGARAGGDDAALTVHLAQSELTLELAPGASILDALVDAGMFVSYECKRGECGHCYTPVLEGAPLHRDVCLSQDQRAAGMCPCVSWAGGGRLVLDL